VNSTLICICIYHNEKREGISEFFYLVYQWPSVQFYRHVVFVGNIVTDSTEKQGLKVADSIMIGDLLYVTG